MPTPTVYVICDTNCKYEGMTKEQIIAAIAEATGNTPTGIDDAFITKLKEQNANGTVKLWIGTTAQFNAVATKDENTLYLLTDDDSADSWDEIAETLAEILNGTRSVVKATQAASIAPVDCSPSAAATDKKYYVPANGYNGVYIGVGATADGTTFTSVLMLNSSADGVAIGTNSTGGCLCCTPELVSPYKVRIYWNNAGADVSGATLRTLKYIPFA